MCLHGRLAQNTRCAVDTQTIGAPAVALSRVRGLKRTNGGRRKKAAEVALSRVRGLKLYDDKDNAVIMAGRTLTSAWIETGMQSTAWTMLLCRTLTSAWIETRKTHNLNSISLVALSRVRGLKPTCTQIYIGTFLSHSHECVD